jgi:hypothetical protein
VKEFRSKIDIENDGLKPAQYRKTALTSAVQIYQPFRCYTTEGVMDGKAGDWLAVDSLGNVYPIADAVFSATYEPAWPEDGCPPD